MKHAHRILIALALALATYRADAQPGTEDSGGHGMLVLGSETIYASHLPMFMPQHRYQGIWEVSFGEEGDRIYRAERARPENAKLIFTLNPSELFRLPELTQTRKSFRADVFLGHFERPGNERILENVKVTVRRQVHWHPFRNSHVRPEPLTYLLFGKGKELFLAHWISLAPNFDQIVSVTPSKPLGEIPEGAQVVITKRSDGDALKAGESVSGMMIAGRPEQPFTVTPVDLKIGSVIYMEEGELARNDLLDGK
jgi:hypothetical protein